MDANQSPVVYAKWFKAPQMTGTGSADFDAWYNWIDQEMVEFEVEYTASCGDTTTCGVANDDASCATNGGLCADGFTLTGGNTAAPVCTPKTYTISFENGAGSDTPSVSVVFGQTDVATQLPVRTGYTFSGYFTGPDGAGCMWYDENLSALQDPWNVPANTTLYAYWTPNEYTVTYDIQGGNWGATSTTQDVTYDSSWQVVLDSYPVKTGYTFGGFYDQANCKGTQYVGATANSGGLLSSTRTWNKVADTKLYACWTANKYTVTYDIQGGDWGATSTTQDVTYNSSWQVILDNYPVKTGYTFGGFYDQANCNGTQYVGATANSSDLLSSTRAWDKVANTQLYACWTANEYTVTYACGDGTGTAPANTTATYDANFTPAANTCVRTGYKFDGWTVSGTNDVKSAGTAFKWQYSADKTLTAKWTIKSDINVPAGYYLPMGTDIPVACRKGYYCEGDGSVEFNENKDQGIKSCPPNYYTDGIGASVKADCKISCPGGYYLAEYGDTECTIAGVGNWIPASTYSWDNELGAVNECPEGETTIGYGLGADEEADCGRKFHVGANILYLRSVKKTTPSLNVKMGNKTYYGNMSEYTSGMTKADAKMSVDATDVLRITDSLTDKEYFVVDDSNLLSDRLELKRWHCLAQGGKWIDDTCECPDVLIEYIDDEFGWEFDGFSECPYYEEPSTKEQECVIHGGIWDGYTCKCPGFDEEGFVIEWDGTNWWFEGGKSCLPGMIQKCLMDSGNEWLDGSCWIDGYPLYWEDGEWV